MVEEKDRRKRMKKAKDEKRNIIPERLKELLDKFGVTQRDLAEAVGVTEVSMSRYICGTRTPRGYVLVRMAKTLHTTPEYLMGLEVTEDPEQAYNRVFRAVSRYAGEWTMRQKGDLINEMLCGGENND